MPIVYKKIVLQHAKSSSDSCKSVSMDYEVGYKIEERTFDLVGNVVEVLIFHEDGSLVHKLKSQYDTGGRLIQKVITKSLNKEKNQTDYMYEFDNQQRISIMREYCNNNPEPTNVHTYTYETDGRYQIKTHLCDVLVGHRSYRADGKLVSEFKSGTGSHSMSSYDDNGTLVCFEVKKKNRPPQRIEYKNEYDQRGNLVRKKNGNRVVQYKYNELNQVIEKITLDKHGQPKQIYTYIYEYFSPNKLL